MLTKILFTLGVIVAALIVLPRVLRAFSRAADRPGPTPPAHVEELIRCPSCGTYRGRHDPCECGMGSTARR